MGKNCSNSGQIHFVYALAFSILCPLFATAQVCGPIPNFPAYVQSIQPDFEFLKKTNKISDLTQQMCVSIATDGEFEQQKLATAQTLFGAEVPFDLKRWVALRRINLLIDGGKKDEIITAARAWLVGFPQPEPPLSPEYVKTHRGEPNANIVLRWEIGRLMRFVVNRELDWSASQRFDLLQEFCEPLLAVTAPSSYSATWVDCTFQYADWLGEVPEMWVYLSSNNRDPNTLPLAQREALEAQQKKARIQATLKQKQVYERLCETLKDFAGESVSVQKDATILRINFERVSRLANNGLESAKQKLAQDKSASAE